MDWKRWEDVGGLILKGVPRDVLVSRTKTRTRGYKRNLLAALLLGCFLRTGETMEATRKTTSIWGREKCEWSEVRQEQGEDGITFRRWKRNDGNIKARVFVMHGIFEHSECYLEMGHALTREGFEVVAQDHWGHGRSKGERGVFENVEKLITPAVELIKKVIGEDEARGKQVPCFLLGHSLGGAICSVVAKEFSQDKDKKWPIRGVILSGAAFIPGPASASPFGVKGLYFLSRLGIVSRGIAATLATLSPKGPAAYIDETEICNDPEHISRIDKDPLYVRGATTNLVAYNSILLIQRAIDSLPLINFPVFCFYGDNDTICLPEGMKIVDNRLRQDIERQLKTYQNAKHDPMSGTAAELVYKDITKFIKSKL